MSLADCQYPLILFAFREGFLLDLILILGNSVFLISCGQKTGGFPSIPGYQSFNAD